MARANWEWSNNYPVSPTFRPEPCTAESEEERIVEAMQHLQGALVTHVRSSLKCALMGAIHTGPPVSGVPRDDQ